MKTVLLVLSLSLVATTISAQVKGILIDGVSGYHERTDTIISRPEFFNDDDIVIRKDSNSYYFAINHGSAGATNLILAKGDSCIIIHISGSIGRGIYTMPAADSFAIRRPILWVTRNPEAWDFIGRMGYELVLKQQRTDTQLAEQLRKMYDELGYTASTVDMGSFRDIEVALARERWKGFRLLIQYRRPIQNTVQLQTSIALFPPQPELRGQLTTFQSFLQATPGTNVKLIFNRDNWYRLD